MSILQLQILVSIFAGWVDRVVVTLDVTGHQATSVKPDRGLDFWKALEFQLVGRIATQMHHVQTC